MAVDLGPDAADPRIDRVGAYGVHVPTGWALQTSERVLAFMGRDEADTGVPFSDMAGALRWLLGGPPLTPLAYALQRTYADDDLHRMRADIATRDIEPGDPWDRLDIAIANALGVPTKEDRSGE